MKQKKCLTEWYSNKKKGKVPRIQQKQLKNRKMTNFIDFDPICEIGGFYHNREDILKSISRRKRSTYRGGDLGAKSRTNFSSANWGREFTQEKVSDILNLLAKDFGAK